MGNVCTRKINSCKNDFRSWVCCLKITKNVWLPSRPLLVDHHYHKLHQYYTLQKNWSVWWVFFSSNNLHLQSRMWKLRVLQMPSSAIFFRYIATLLYKDLKSSHQAHLKWTCALGETGISVSIYVDFVPDQKSSAVECGRGRKSSKSDQWRVRKKH